MKQEKNSNLTPREKALSDNKKLIIIFGLITLALAVTTSVLEVIVGLNVGFIMVLCLLSLVLFFGGIIDRKKIKRSYCPYCGEHYNYEDDVSWEVSNVVESANDTRANVDFNCACSNCGEETSFTQNFRVGYFKNGNYVEENIFNVAKKYFK